MTTLVLEKKANEFRNVHGLGSNDSIHLKGLLHKLNVLTIYRPLSAGFSGMAMRINYGQDVNRFVLINSNKTIGHQHFTICHELYHLFVQQDFTSMVCVTGEFQKKNKEEYNADVFAAHLLLPESGIKSLIPDEELDHDKVKLSTVLKIEQYFSCSRQALLYRLKSLGIISSQRKEQLGQNVKRGAVEFGYKTSLYEPGNHYEVIGDYGSLARELFEREDISETHYYSLLTDLGIDVGEIDSLEDARA